MVSHVPHLTRLIFSHSPLDVVCIHHSQAGSITTALVVDNDDTSKTRLSAGKIGSLPSNWETSTTRSKSGQTRQHQPSNASLLDDDHDGQGQSNERLIVCQLCERSVRKRESCLIYYCSMALRVCQKQTKKICRIKSPRRWRKRIG